MAVVHVEILGIQGGNRNGDGNWAHGEDDDHDDDDLELYGDAVPRDGGDGEAAVGVVLVFIGVVGRGEGAAQA